MSLSDRDYVRGHHPPTCTCVLCSNHRGELELSQSEKAEVERLLRAMPRAGNNRIIVYVAALTVLLGGLLLIFKGEVPHILDTLKTFLASFSGL